MTRPFPDPPGERPLPPEWERKLSEDAAAEAVALRVLRGIIPALPGETVADQAYKLATVYRAHRGLLAFLRDEMHKQATTMEHVTAVQGCTPKREPYDPKLTYGT